MDVLPLASRNSYFPRRPVDLARKTQLVYIEAEIGPPLAHGSCVLKPVPYGSTKKREPVLLLERAVCRAPVL